MDALCEHGGVGVGHVASGAPLVVAGKTLYARVLATPGLPPAVVKIAEAAGENSDADEETAGQGVRVAGEVDPRAAGERRERRRRRRPRRRQAAGRTVPAGSPSAVDRGEPTWVCLGRMVSNLSFVHVWRRTCFLHHQLGVPTDEFVKAAAPLVEVHPYRQYLATYTEDPAYRRLAWEQVTIPEPDDLEYQEASLWLEYQSRHLPAAAGMQQMIESRQDDTPRDFYRLSASNCRRRRQDHAVDWTCAGPLLRESPFSPVGPALAIEFCGDDYQVAVRGVGEGGGRLSCRGHGLRPPRHGRRRWEEAEKWLKLVTATGDTDAFAATGQGV